MSPESGQGRGVLTGNSDWMSQLPPELHSIPLFDLAIPGSHDSMSYDLDLTSSIVEPARLRRFSRIYCLRKIVRRWAVTQEVSITKQLDAGVRYLDLRVARKPNDSDPTRLYFYHGLYTNSDVETVLKDIHNWTMRHPKEIVILSFSNFRGFEQKTRERFHIHLIYFMKNLFGPRLVPKSDSPTLKSCWEQGRNVIISYDYAVSYHPEIWRIFKYYYGNTMDHRKVESTLSQVLEKERPSKSFFVCGLNLTLPSDIRILRYIVRLWDDFGSVLLRSLPKLVKWLKQESDKAAFNIVASDMVTRDTFISTVIALNRKHAKE